MLSAVLFGATPAMADGVDLGDAELNASLITGLGYDSNVFRAGAQDADGPQGAPRAELTPRLRLTTPDPMGLDLSLLASMTWQQYLSSDRFISGQSGPELNLNGDARINPRGDVSLRLGESLRRTNDAAYIPTGETEHVLMNNTMIALGLHPGGAQLSSRMGLSGEARGYYRFWQHNVAESADSSALGGALDLAYNFLPMTAVTAQVDVMSQTYVSPGRGIVTQEGPSDERLANYNGRPIRSALGFRGLVSRRMTLEASGGYTFVTYTNQLDDTTVKANTWNALVGLGYLINSDDTFDVSLRRHQTATAYGNPAQSYTLATELTRRTSDFELRGRLQYQLYGLLGDTSQLQGDGTGGILSTRLALAVPVADWVYVGGFYQLSANFTTIAVNTDLGVGDESYLQHNAFITMEFRY